MPAAILDQGRTAIRNSIKTLITHVGVTTDQTAFSATQTALNPSGSGVNLIKPATKTDVNGSTFDATITLDGTTEFTNQTINCIGALSGATRTDAVTRNVRGSGLGIGVQAGDTLTIGVRVTVADNS